MEAALSRCHGYGRRGRGVQYGVGPTLAAGTGLLDDDPEMSGGW